MNYWRQDGVLILKRSNVLAKCPLLYLSAFYSRDVIGHNEMSLEMWLKPFTRSYAFRA